jgi:type IV secretion system protein VirB9
MPIRWSPLFVVAATLVAGFGHAQSETGPPGARTVVAHPREVTALRAKIHYTTLIVLPEDDEVVEATCGDKDVWIVNVRGSLVSVKPAKAGSETNLNVITASGRVYAFLLTEISDVKNGEPDLTVYLDADDPAGAAAARDRPKYVPAQQVEDFRAQAELAREDARRAAEAARSSLESGLTTFRTTYPLGLRFPYRFPPNKAPLYIRAMFHDDHLTFIQAHAAELPSLYELKDGLPNLVNFDVRDGTYVVPKILGRGYFQLGKQQIRFDRIDER